LLVGILHQSYGRPYGPSRNHQAVHGTSRYLQVILRHNNSGSNTDGHWVIRDRIKADNGFELAIAGHQDVLGERLAEGCQIFSILFNFK